MCFRFMCENKQMTDIQLCILTNKHHQRVSHILKCYLYFFSKKNHYSHWSCCSLALFYVTNSIKFFFFLIIFAPSALICDSKLEQLVLKKSYFLNQLHIKICNNDLVHHSKMYRANCCTLQNLMMYYNLFFRKRIQMYCC